MPVKKLKNLYKNMDSLFMTKMIQKINNYRIWAPYSLKTWLFMLVNGKMEKDMAEEPVIGKMELYMKDIGKMVINK
jgi:hypothetical protein